MKPLLIVLSVFVMSACAMPNAKRDPTREDVSREMRDASQALRTQEATERALLAPLAVAQPTIKESEPRFDLSVVNAPVQQVFMAIVNGTRYSMLMTPDVSGNVTINLKNVTVVEALDSIRDLYGYEYTIKASRISIQPNTMQSRVFQVNYLAALRTGETELRVSSGGVGNTTSSNSGTGSAVAPTGQSTSQTTPSNPTSRVRTTSNSDFWGSLTTALTAIIGNADGRGVVVNPMAGVILVRAYPKEIRAAEQYLKAIQAIADRQVMLEAKIIEVTLSDSFQAGINWATFHGSNSRGTVGIMEPGARLGPTGVLRSPPDVLGARPGLGGSVITRDIGQGFFGLALQTANFAALINFLETQGSVSVLSSPRVATLNNQKAVLKVGTDELYVTNITTNTTTSGGVAGNTVSPTITLQPYFSGISLDVTPQIDEDDNIVLHIHPAVTTVTEKEKSIDLGRDGGTYKLPLAASTVNETDSIVRARDGYIVAVGGLMSSTSQKDATGLPGTLETDVGGLVGQRTRNNQKRELVILLKPTLIKNEKSWQQDIDATTQRIENMGR